MTSCIHDHGRWGKGDQLGAGHFLTPERTLAALRMVRDGRIVDMSHMIEIGAPRMAPNQSPYHIQAGPTSAGSIRRRRKMGAKNDAGSNLERIENRLGAFLFVWNLEHSETKDWHLHAICKFHILHVVSLSE